MKKDSATHGLPSSAIGASHLRRIADSSVTLWAPRAFAPQYTGGVPNPEKIAPEGYALDAAMIQRPGNMDIQLDLFLDYANNVKLYPAFQEYFRKSKPPLLAIWGKKDPFFIPAGAQAFLRDNPNATLQLLDTGHFSLETHVEEIAGAMREFLSKNVAESSKARAS
jgi:pimeloyl-ACP methyl ester carboxylesterase